LNRLFRQGKIICRQNFGLNFRVVIPVDHGTTIARFFIRKPGLIPRPLERKTGGVGDLFPHRRKDFKEKSSIPLSLPGDSLFVLLVFDHIPRYRIVGG
jgi:hypothetical protein